MLLSAMNKLYDTIGLNYANLRKPDPIIARQIDSALGNAKTVLNVGAGAGSYEPSHRQVTAIEPSSNMISQRSASEVKLVQGSAEELPFADKSFDASMAILTIHHWNNQEKGVREMRRVSRDKIVFLTFDPSFDWFWLADYFPALVDLDNRQMPQMRDYEKWLGPVKISSVPIPHDCKDGFLASYWKRPAAYLDERVRSSISSFWAIGDLTEGLKRLETDLASGGWEKKNQHLLDLDELDCGYRLVESA